VNHDLNTHASEADGQLQRMTQTVDGHEGLNPVDSNAVITAAVNSENAPQPFGLGIDWPVSFMSQIQRESAGRQHGADHSQFVNSTPQLDNRLVDVLQRDQSHAFEAGAFFPISFLHPLFFFPPPPTRPTRLAYSP